MDGCGEGVCVGVWCCWSSVGEGLRRVTRPPSLGAGFGSRWLGCLGRRGAQRSGVGRRSGPRAGVRRLPGLGQPGEVSGLSRGERLELLVPP